MSKSLTVEEFVKETENEIYNIEHEDSWNIHVEMMKVIISYDEEFNEIVFSLVDGGASFFVDAELIDEIIEENSNFNIKFSGVMSELSVTKKQ